MFHVFLINVNAGKNNSNMIGKIIDEHCKSKYVMHAIEYVYKKEDTVEIIKKYKNFDDVVLYSIGGDGTLNQTINCIANTNINLNVLPAGTGNDFYRSLENYKGNKVDLGKVNDKYFINVASFGIDAEIANTANEYKNKNLKGTWVYPLSIVKNFFPYRALSTKVDNIEKLITIVTICNAKYYGGGFNIAPTASLNDGLFDIYEVGKLNKLKILKLILELTQGKHINNKNINFYRTDKIKIESDFDLICNLDGEIVKGNSFDFSICKEAISLSRDDLKIKELLKSKRIIK